MKVKELVSLVEVNTTAVQEHVAVIEGKIRHVKERVQKTTSKTPSDGYRSLCWYILYIFVSFG